MLASRLSPLAAIALAIVLGFAPPVRAQLTTDELKTFNQLFHEPNEKASFDKRLKLIGAALDRLSDVRRLPTTSYQVSLKGARIPPADGLAFLARYFDHPAEITKRAALRMLGDYGNDAKPALPKVRQLLKGPIRGVREDAMLTAGRIDPANREIAAAILDRLGAPGVDDSENRAVIQALILMAPAVDKAAVPRLAKFLDHRWTETCLYAHDAIGKILNLPRPSLQELQALEVIDWRGTPDHAYAILAAIRNAGPKGEFAVPLLVELLITNPPVYLQCAVFDTLGKIKTGNPRIISLMLERLTSTDLVLRYKANQTLRQIDLSKPASVRAMAHGLRHADRGVRFQAAVALRSADQLGKVSPAGLAEMWPPLLATIREINDEVPPGQLDVYLTLLRHLNRTAEPAAETVFKLYQSETYFSKIGAREAAHRRAKLLAVLAHIGVPKAARPVVMEVLKKGPQVGDGYAYTAAARAVGTFSADAKPAVPWLLPALKADGKETVHFFIDWSGKSEGYPPTSARLEAIRALGAIGPDAKEALPALKEIAARQAGPAGTLEAIIPREAQRAVAAIDKAGK